MHQTKNCELSGHSTLARADGKPKKRKSNMKAKNKQVWMAGVVAWAAVLYIKECDVALKNVMWQNCSY